MQIIWLWKCEKKKCQGDDNILRTLYSLFEQVKDSEDGSLHLQWAFICTIKPRENGKFFTDWHTVASRASAHFTAHSCPAVRCQSFTALSGMNVRRMPPECHLTPPTPPRPPVNPGWPSRFHIFPLLNNNVSSTSSVSTLSNSPITLLITLLLSSLFPHVYSKEKKKKCLSTSREHGRVMSCGCLGKESVCEMQSGSECVDFGKIQCISGRVQFKLKENS